MFARWLFTALAVESSHNHVQDRKMKEMEWKRGPLFNLEAALLWYPSVNVFSGLIGQDRVTRSPLVAQEAENKPSLLLSWSFFFADLFPKNVLPPDTGVACSFISHSSLLISYI